MPRREQLAPALLLSVRPCVWRKQAGKRGGGHLD